jgi:hypothetical protein
VLLAHWGYEYEYWPGALQTEHARRLIELGADVIVGSSPHVLQPVELVSVDGADPACPLQARRGGPPGFALIAWSLGNLATILPTLGCRVGALLELDVGRSARPRRRAHRGRRERPAARRRGRRRQRRPPHECRPPLAGAAIAAGAATVPAPLAGAASAASAAPGVDATGEAAGGVTGRAFVVPGAERALAHRALVVLGPNDAYAAAVDERRRASVLAHFDGSGWFADVPPPSSEALRALTAEGDGTLWAVTERHVWRRPPAGAWAEVPAPGGGEAGATWSFRDVWANGPGDVWIAAQRETGAAPRHVVLRTKEVPTPVRWT